MPRSAISPSEVHAGPPRPRGGRDRGQDGGGRAAAHAGRLPLAPEAAAGDEQGRLRLPPRAQREVSLSKIRILANYTYFKLVCMALLTPEASVGSVHADVA